LFLYGRIEGAEHGEGFRAFVRYLSLWFLGIMYLISFGADLKPIFPLLIGGLWTMGFAYYIHRQIS
jgi:hypothetical protein